MARAAAAGNLLGEVLQRLGLTAKLREYRTWAVWDAVVGPQIAAHARPARVRDGVLEVRVDQAVWMQQLQLLKPTILARLNGRLGEGTLRDIFWQRGRPSAAAAEPPGPPYPQPPPRLDGPLPAETLAEIESALAPLDDPALRRRLHRLLVRQARLSQARQAAAAADPADTPR
jgi:hypothetical protein